MKLQAFIDDSGSEPQSPVFLLAGHIAPMENWKRFSNEWQACLAKAPGARYYKSSEAMHLQGEFGLHKGWSSDLRDERVIELSKIIAEHCPVAVSAVIRHQDFGDTIKLLPKFQGRRTLGNDHPYLFLWYHLISELWMHSPQLGLDGPCEFIFDRQLGFEKEALAFWLILEAEMRKPPLPPWHDWIGSPPTFRDDQTFYPLQAADMHAWANRRALCHDPDDLKMPPEAIANLCKPSARHLDFTRRVMLHEALRATSLMTRALRDS
jgi:hypothetical protein